ncbi:hypothetical protein Bbelb_145280 [Branchiostoma belcheri]|nr:hypothetical protein Bbelb_145280 [Branchiostoma belcheri]
MGPYQRQDKSQGCCKVTSTECAWSYPGQRMATTCEDSYQSAFTTCGPLHFAATCLTGLDQTVPQWLVEMMSTLMHIMDPSDAQGTNLAFTEFSQLISPPNITENLCMTHFLHVKDENTG